MSSGSNPGSQKNATAQAGDARAVNGQSDSCDISIDVDLTGVRAQTLAAVADGETLSVRLDRAVGRYDLIVCVRDNGDVVGSINNTAFQTALINCLARNVRYQVIVTARAVGGCHVVGGRVRP